MLVDEDGILMWTANAIYLIMHYVAASVANLIDRNENG